MIMMMRLSNFLTVVTLVLFHQVNCDAFLKAPPSINISIRSSSSSGSGSSAPALHKITPQLVGLQHKSNRHLEQRLSISFPSRGGGGGGNGSVRGRGSGIGSKLYAIDPSSLTPVFNNAPLAFSTNIYVITNLLGFIISALTGSHLHLDLLGTGCFALASLPALFSSSTVPTRVLLSSSAVTIWGTKLASFLFFRATKLKTDTRLTDTLSTTGGTASFWIVSLVWGLICSLPHTLGATSSSEGSKVTLVIGSVVYLLGLVTESKADYQKWIFKNNNPGSFCNVGLWSVSQHPNFFGNLLLWSGIYIMNVDSLLVSGDGSGGIGGMLSSVFGSWRAWVALLSPLFMFTLFYGQSSGAFMNSVELANKKYGSDTSYGEYVTNVPLIIPQLFKWLKCLFS